MLKKLPIPILLAAAVITSADAYVAECVQETGNMKLVYPLVYEADRNVQHNINTDIARYVVAEKAFYESGRAKNVELSYDVTYEDDDYLSLILTPYHYFDGAAHGQYLQIGRVYSKRTGDALPLSYFVHIPSPDRLTEGLRNHTLSLYSQTRAIPMQDDSNWKTVPYISDSYYLRGEGFIDLIYQPYEMGPFAAGATRIEISPSAAAAFNAEFQNRP